MTAGVTAKVALSLIGQFTGSNDLSSLVQQIAQSLVTDFQPGTGLGKANEVFADTRTLAASATENLDLSGSLKDAFGATVAFTKIKAVIIAAHAANVNNVRVGGAASNPFVGWLVDATDATHLVVEDIPPGSWMVRTNPAGWTVTAATGDILKVTNGGGTTGVDYDIILIGE